MLRRAVSVLAEITSHVLSAVCMWEVSCGCYSEAARGVHGLHMADVVPMRCLWEVADSQAVIWVASLGRHRVLFGCRLCGCGGICFRGVGEGSSVLFTVWCGGQVAVYEPELSEGGVSGVLSKCIGVSLSYACAVQWLRHVCYDGGWWIGIELVQPITNYS